MKTNLTNLNKLSFALIVILLASMFTALPLLASSEPSYSVELLKESEKIKLENLTITAAPFDGEGGKTVTGTLDIKTANSYGVISIIHMPDGLSYLKPSQTKYLTPVKNSKFTAEVFTEAASDYNAEAVSLYFVPNKYKQSFPLAPNQEYAIAESGIEELLENSLLAVIIAPPGEETADEGTDAEEEEIEEEYTEEEDDEEEINTNDSIDLLKDSDALKLSDLSIDYIPYIGEKAMYISGELDAKNADSYEIVTIIHMPDGLSYLKPSQANYITSIDEDGWFDARVYTDSVYDYDAEAVSLYFVKKGYKQKFPIASGQQYAIAESGIDKLLENSLLAVLINKEDQ